MEYYVIYADSQTRRVSSPKHTLEQCHDYIKRAKEIDRLRGHNYVYTIVQTIN